MDSSPLSFARQSMESVYHVAKNRLHRWTKPGNHDPVLDAALDQTRSVRTTTGRHAPPTAAHCAETTGEASSVDWRDRTLFVLLASRLRTWKQVLVIVQPETVLRWHRDLFRWVRRRNSKPLRRGKPPLTGDLVFTIKRIAKENRSWGVFV